MTHRYNADERREMIREAVQIVAKQRGKWGVTHKHVAKACRIETSASTVRRYFKLGSDLRALVE